VLAYTIYEMVLAPIVCSSNKMHREVTVSAVDCSAECLIENLDPSNGDI
jgi:hypothetical protein